MDKKTLKLVVIDDKIQLKPAKLILDTREKKPVDPKPATGRKK